MMMSNAITDSPRYIEPCCYSKQLTMIMKRCEAENNGFPACAHFFSYSDWDTRELIPFIASHVEQCELTVCLIHPTVQTLGVLKDVMKREIITDAAKGEKGFLVKRLLLVCQPGIGNEGERLRMEVCSYLFSETDSERVVYAEDNIAFRCIAAGNDHRHLILQGSINQQQCNATQMFTLTTDRIAYEEAMEVLRSKARTKKVAWQKLSHPNLS